MSSSLLADIEPVMPIDIRPLTPALWPALEDLFEGQWPVGRCWCMYWRIGNDYRKQSAEANKAAFCERVTKALIAAALDTARQAGAPALEAYPLDPELSPSASSMGFVSTFERMGFKEVARHVPPRPIRWRFPRFYGSMSVKPSAYPSARHTKKPSSSAVTPIKGAGS